MIIAMDAEEMLLSLGAGKVLTANSVKEAMRLLDAMIAGTAQRPFVLPETHIFGRTGAILLNLANLTAGRLPRRAGQGSRRGRSRKSIK